MSKHSIRQERTGIDSGRRDVLRAAAGGMIAASCGSLAAALPWPRLPEEDFAARAVGYRIDGTRADAGRHPRAAAGLERCGNCRFFHGGPDTAWAGCPLFPERHVSRNGWCRAWTALDAGA